MRSAGYPSNRNVTERKRRIKGFIIPRSENNLISLLSNIRVKNHLLLVMSFRHGLETFF